MVDVISNGHNWLIFLSVPLYCPYIAVQDQTIYSYVAGHASAVAEAHEQLQAYIYDVSTNQWRQLPTPWIAGQYYGTPCIIKGKLLLVDIFSNAMNIELTCRELTLMKQLVLANAQISYHPNMLSSYYD